jgi:NADH-quinone oxidoreductase subunit B
MVELPGVLGEPIRFVLNWGRRYSLWVFNFGLACCAIEFIATSMGRHDFIRLGVIPFAHGPRQADLMVVSGTVTDKMAPAVKRLYDQMPEPKYVISFGACSNCGGPYWDSYSVTKGVDQLIPVDVYVPGCPPRPEALLHGILRLQEKIAQERSGIGGVNQVDARALSAPLVRPPRPDGVAAAPVAAAALGTPVPGGVPVRPDGAGAHARAAAAGDPVVGVEPGTAAGVAVAVAEPAVTGPALAEPASTGSAGAPGEEPATG